jgi:hypothetical protein
MIGKDFSQSARGTNSTSMAVAVTLMLMCDNLLALYFTSITHKNKFGIRLQKVIQYEIMKIPVEGELLTT